MKVLEYHGVLGGPAGATCQLLLIVGRAPVFDRSQDGQEEQSDKGRKMALPFSVEVTDELRWSSGMVGEKPGGIGFGRDRGSEDAEMFLR